MADYDNFKESLKSTFSGVAGMAKNLVSNAGDKAKALSRIAKLSIDVNAEKENKKKVYTEIGKLYFETNKETPGDFFIQLFDEINLADEQISAMEAELAELKSSLGENMGEPIVDPSGSFEEVVEAEEASAAEADVTVEIEITEETPGEDAPKE
ncbi:MAG: hypothetical protein EOM17_14920 [Synergistales bacterium]|nr:hypothetical protein [Clostridia bacterium]NCC58892.1 hypothetical protein [Synergistales bacterium]